MSVEITTINPYYRGVLIHIMEEILTVILESSWKILRFIFWHTIFEIVLFNIGRVFLLIVTFGNFPKTQHIQNNETKISLAGVIGIIIIWGVIAVYNNL